MSERSELSIIANNLYILGVDYDSGFNGKLGKYRKSTILDYVDVSKVNSVLEVGCAHGSLTEFLSVNFNRIIGLEPTHQFFVNLCKRFELVHNNLELHEMLFEEYETEEKFDMIISAGVLEHIESVDLYLQKAKSLMHTNSILVTIVPNAEALHRQIGLHMGMINGLCDLNENDISFGHLRYFNMDSLDVMLKKNKFKTICNKGIFLKPEPNDKMDYYTEQHCDALYEIGKSYPKLCAEIFNISMLDIEEVV